MAQTTYTFADYTAGTQYAENEEHVLDEDVTLYTTQCHFTTELRVYSSETHNGFFVSNELPNFIQSLGFKLGNKVDDVAIYGSNDGSNWNSVGTISVTSTSYNDYTIDFGENNYKYFKFDVVGTQQVRAKTMTITYKGASTPTVATPTFNPEAGTYTSAQNVAIACATEGATIYYTTNGDDPTTSSTEYSAAIPVSATTTIKAFAVKADMENSAIASAEYVINTTPAINVDVETLSFSSTNETKTINVSSSNLTEDITVTVSGNFTVSSATIAMNTDATLNVVFTGDASTSGTLTLTSGTITKTITLTAEPIVISGEGYVLVSAAQENWAGDYLITNVNGNTVMVLSEISTTSTKYGIGVDMSEYHANNMIASNSTTDQYKVTIAPTTNGYSMYLNGAGYLGWSNGNSLKADESFTEGVNEWTFSFSDGVVTIANAGTPDRIIRWNNSSPRFACYIGGQQDITLYKSNAAPIVATPTFNPEEGIYATAQNVEIVCATEGATIYYTTDGNDPTTESDVYSAAISVSETTTVKAIAVKAEMQNSEIATATYTINTLPFVATPVITPAAGDYVGNVEVTIACDTEDANIYYTTNGDEPTAESVLYSESFILTADATVKAIAMKADMNNSEIATAEYTITPALANLAAVYETANNDEYVMTGDVTFVYRNGRNIYVKDETAGMIIFDNYTSVITTEYQEGDVISGGISAKTTIYNGLYEMIPLANTAVATTNTGAVAPTTITVEQLLSGNYTSQLVKVENVTIASGTTFTEGSTGANLTFAQGDNAAKLRNNFKTLDMTIADNSTLNITGFVSVFGDEIQLFPRSNDDVELIVVEAPTFTPVAGTFTEQVTVTIACEDTEATIYYTLNEEETAVAYTEPLEITQTTTINAYAEKNGVRSEVVSATYTIVVAGVVANPVISPNGGTFETTQEVTITCATEGASVYYTLNGEDPTAESTLYETPIIIEATTTVKAIAVKAEMTNSEVVSATFTKVEPQPAIEYTRVTSLSELQDGDRMILASRYNNDATNYYVVTNRISNKLSVIPVVADNNIISTNVDTVVWTVRIIDGNYKFVNASNDTLCYGTSTSFAANNSNTVWTVEEYTTETIALVPSYAGFKMTNPVADTRAIALKADSNVIGVYAFSNATNETYSSNYNFALDIFADMGEHAPIVATPTFSVPAGLYTSAQTVEIACATEDATIRYTLDGTEPTEASAEYTVALTISETTTVKAKAFKTDYIASSVATAEYVINTNPIIIVDAETLNFTLTNETKTVNVSSYNLTEDITVTVTENFTVNAETITMNTEAVLNVVFTGETPINGTLTLTSGETTVNVALIATPLVVSEGAYIPVTDNQEDWSGDYLITFTDLTTETINALNGVSDNNIGTFTNVFEHYADGMITSNLTTEACKVTIAPTANGYSMYLNQVGYLALTSEANKLFVINEFAESTAEWTFTNNAGDVVINNVQYTDRRIRWNESNPRFACYGSTSSVQGPIALYKLSPLPSVATPVFNPVGGYYEETQNVTITCSAPEAVIYYTANGEEPTNQSTLYENAIPVSENTTIKAIAYVGEEFSYVATAIYTFPQIVENIADLYAVENQEGTFKLVGDVTFVYENGNNIYVKDETAGLLIYDSNNKITTEYVEGDVIEGGISGTISMYHGLFEFVPVSNTAEATTNTGTVTPTIITVEELLTGEYMSQLVTVQNVTVATGAVFTEGSTGSSVTFAQNGFEAILRNNFKTLDMTIADNSTLTITGFGGVYDDAIQMFPRNNNDITVVTDIEEFASEISIYPNPTRNIVNISMNGMNRVELVNANGQIVYSENALSDVVVISLEEQPAGMYFVRIYSSDEVVVSKVTKF